MPPAFLMNDEHAVLIERVTDGFGALMEQVQALAARNDAQAQRLSQLSAEVRGHTIYDDESAILDGEPGQQHGQGTRMPKNARTASRLGQRPGAVESGDLDTEEREKARLIAEGVQAWKKLTEQKVPDPTGAAAAAAAAGRSSTPSTVASSPIPKGGGSGHKSQRKVNEQKAEKESEALNHHPREHSPGQESRKLSENISPARSRTNTGVGEKCPFALTFGSMPVGSPKIERPDTGTQRPEILPTPENSIKPIRSTTASKRRISDALSSAPPSAVGSTSKCPIRFLDHYSPEEVAEYFKNHKHEIPRSHEVCVKRYQSNAESIRQLDAKYGNLVTMIQGLGEKHQSLLPDTKEDDDNLPAMHGKSIEHIQHWAEGVQDGPEGALDITTKPDSISSPQLRQGRTRETTCNTTEQANSRAGRSHLAFNLKEIGVGESPSRLGGITVPMHFRGNGKDDGDGDNDDQSYSQSAADGPDSQTSLLQERPRQPRAGRQHPKMVFTGPVFIGYSPEQAATVLRQPGLKGKREGHRVSMGG
ncbi:MAG: hypothetical protein Q9195_008381 [Heterodermia aff. obscurata]